MQRTTDSGSALVCQGAGVALPGTGQRPSPSSRKSAPVGTVQSGHGRAGQGGILKPVTSGHRQQSWPPGWGCWGRLCCGQHTPAQGPPRSPEARGGAWTVGLWPPWLLSPPASTCDDHSVPACWREGALAAARSSGEGPSQHPLVLPVWRLSLSSCDSRASCSIYKHFPRPEPTCTGRPLPLLLSVLLPASVLFHSVTKLQKRRLCGGSGARHCGSELGAAGAGV